METAVRLVNWATAWQRVGGVDGIERDFAARWLTSVYQHASFIRGWFTLHSSAGHRLIGEAAGLFVAALTWPHWREASGWAATAKAVLEREALAQVGPDGVDREQSVCVQQFVLDLFMLALLAGKANGQWFSADYESRIETMLDFLASIMDTGGNLPALGDSDDNFVPAQSLLATGA